MLIGFKVIDANGRSLTYFYARENEHDAGTDLKLEPADIRRMRAKPRKAWRVMSNGETLGEQGV